MKQMSTEDRIELIESITKNGGEIVGKDELKEVLESGQKLYTYDGFEPSGQMHIAQGIIRAINVNKMVKAGFTFRMWVADWFGYLNNKMGGDLEKIKTVGQYFIEIWKASGMASEGVEFMWTSDVVGNREYWELVMKVSKSLTLKRALRAVEIMGRSEDDSLSAAQILYPAMQITDIFGVMHARVTQLGLDQRKVNILAREVGPDLGFWKPIVVSHGMLQGLQKPAEKKRTEIRINSSDVGKIVYKGQKADVKLNQFSNTEIALDFVSKNGNTLRTEPAKTNEKIKFFDMDITLTAEGQVEILENTPERMISMKMSKSKPETAIFMTDSEDDVRRKIIKAYAPEGQVDDNPVLDYCKQIIFEAHYLEREEPLLEDGKFVVKRKEEHGGNLIFNSYEELEKTYASKELFPLDLKNAVIEYLNKLLDPVRKHFEVNDEAREILQKVQSYKTTR